MPRITHIIVFGLFVPLSVFGLSVARQNPLVTARTCPIILIAKNLSLVEKEVLRTWDDRTTESGQPWRDFRFHYEIQIVSIQKNILSDFHLERGQKIEFYTDYISDGWSIFTDETDFIASMPSERAIFFLQLDESARLKCRRTYPNDVYQAFHDVGVFAPVDIDGRQKLWTTENWRSLSYSHVYPSVRRPGGVAWPMDIETAIHTVLKSFEGDPVIIELIKNGIDADEDFEWLDLSLIGLCNRCDKSELGGGHYIFANQDLCRSLGRSSPAEAKLAFCQKLRERLRAPMGVRQKERFQQLERLNEIKIDHLDLRGVPLKEALAQVNRLIYEKDPSFGPDFWKANFYARVNISLKNLNARRIIDFVSLQVNGKNFISDVPPDEKSFQLHLVRP